MKKLAVAAFLVLSLAYLVWPYAILQQLNGVLLADDRPALGQLVDIEAVRREITRKLNRDAQSAVGEVSNAFVDWLQEGIRRLGSSAVERLVTLEWVRSQLLGKCAAGSGEGFLPQVSYAFFDAYDRFFVRLGDPGQRPLYLQLRLDGLDWRVIAVYY
jgi:hypothetical protein